MSTTILIKVEVDTGLADSVPAEAIVHGLVSKLGDGVISVPMGSSSKASFGKAQITKLESFAKASQSAEW